MTRVSVTKSWRFALPLLGAVLVPIQACTDLSENPPSAITPDHFYRNEGEVLSSLAGIYAQLRSTLDDYYNISEITTDEMVVPTRGSDWYDGGQWLELHRQTWNPVSPVGNGFGNGAWVVAFTGISRANALLEALPNLTFASRDTVAAEVRTLRAFYYYFLMDLFGGVPVVTTTELKQRPRETRDSVFKFIAAELNAVRPTLPPEWDAANHGRMTQGAADAILASMYLNAEVFTGTVTTGGLTRGPARWQDASDAADRILNGGIYQLAATYAEPFRSDNGKSKENILVVKFVPQADLGLNFVMRSLHYNQFGPPTPWNGFATLAETYNAFDAADQRRQSMLEGPQFNVETNQPAYERGGARLDFTPTIADVTDASESEGVRPYKWPVDRSHVEQNNGNDFAYFRVGEIMLIKAEAQNELGNPAVALGIVNTLRARDFSPAQLLPTSVSQDSARTLIRNERLFELTFEAKRRQDLIRYGKYGDTWGFKTTPSAPYRVLMPIPQNQRDANPLLTQNAGY
jgi:starch-binding outer membrane protein, SusD/RagB family